MGFMIRVPLLLILALISFLLVDLSQAKHGKKIPSATVTGTVYCDTCYQQDFSETSHFISGASVAVKCGGDKDSKEGFYKEVKTNAQGVFEVDLPTAVSKHAKRIKACSVKLIHSSEPSCAVASSATSSSLHLKGRKEGTHVFSAGLFAFKPLERPEICDKKPTVPNLNKFRPNKPVSQSLDLSAVPHATTIPRVPTTVPTIPPSEDQKNVAVESKATRHSKDGLMGKKMFRFLPLFPPLLQTPPRTIGGIPLPPNPFHPPFTSGVPPVLPTAPAAPGTPAVPAVPVIPPALPTTPAFPGIPGFPVFPGIPTIPLFLPTPPSQGVPTVPSIPPGPSPGTPVVPSIPPVLTPPPTQGTPVVPSIPPALPTPTAPGIPSIPPVLSTPPSQGTPTVPGIPPVFPTPPALEPPAIPSIPPAFSTPTCQGTPTVPSNPPALPTPPTRETPAAPGTPPVFLTPPSQGTPIVPNFPPGYPTPSTPPSQGTPIVPNFPPGYPTPSVPALPNSPPVAPPLPRVPGLPVIPIVPNTPPTSYSKKVSP